MIRLVFLLLGLVSAADAQVQNKILSPDTLENRLLIAQPMDDGPLFPLSFCITHENYQYFLPQPAWSDVAPQPWMPSEKEDLLLPWKLQLKAERENSIISSFLGAVEAGGTGYAAYRHLKKFGFK